MDRGLSIGNGRTSHHGTSLIGHQASQIMQAVERTAFTFGTMEMAGMTSVETIARWVCACLRVCVPVSLSPHLSLSIPL